MPPTSGPYDSVDSYANPVSRDHALWFSKETKHFFRSRISEFVYGGRVFVTSQLDSFPPEGLRRYVVHIATADKRLERLEPPKYHATRAQAHAAAAKFAADYAAELPTMTAARVREINTANGQDA